MLNYKIAATFTKGYIANPYWPEMARLIDIQKQSGVNRARSAANRRKALDEYLRANGMKLTDYEELERLAARPFHTNGSGALAHANANASADAHADGSSPEIIIPEEKVYAFLVNACDVARSANRPCPPEQIRTLIKATDWHTGKTKPDGVWERFAVVASGTGQKLSNQRGFRSSQYISNFTATGSVEINPSFVKPDVLRRLIEWGGENIGIGASRKMGWGRFTLEWTE
jgi:hypothetical protein